MKKSVTKKRIFGFVLIALIIATLAFIFSNSLKSQADSGSDSAAVGGILAALLPVETPLGAFVQENLRSIAHFSEFALLGAEVALFVAFFTEKRLLWALMSPLFGLAVGFIDESLQYLSDRAPEISDVWLDLGGFTSLATLTYIILTIVAYVKYRMEEAKERSMQNG